MSSTYDRDSHIPAPLQAEEFRRSTTENVTIVFYVYISFSEFTSVNYISSYFLSLLKSLLSRLTTPSLANSRSESSPASNGIACFARSTTVIGTPPANANTSSCLA